MRNSLPTAIRLQLDDNEEKRILEIADRTGLSVPWIVSHFVKATLHALPDKQKFALPVELSVKPDRQAA